MFTIDSLPQKAKFILYRGDTLYREVQFTDINDEIVNLQNAELQFLVKEEETVFDLSNVLSINEAENVIIIDIKPDNFTDWTFSKAIYDLQITFESGDVLTLLYGSFEIKGDVS